ncbi:hypothetical protein RIF29_31050 [Crotalaria pallida]|uniref:Uncharacterized protein n=1 Tax=Crotalaria pallida TaxID=3830 RepID=A0AAN9I1M2_CROPI
MWKGGGATTIHVYSGSAVAVPLEEKNILTVRKEEEEDDNDGHAKDVKYNKGDSVLVGPCGFLVGFGLVMLFCDSVACS